MTSVSLMTTTIVPDRITPTHDPAYKVRLSARGRVGALGQLGEPRAWLSLAHDVLGRLEVDDRHVLCDQPHLISTRRVDHMHMHMSCACACACACVVVVTREGVVAECIKHLIVGVSAESLRGGHCRRQQPLRFPRVDGGGEYLADAATLARHHDRQK